MGHTIFHRGPESKVFIFHVRVFFDTGGSSDIDPTLLDHGQQSIQSGHVSGSIPLQVLWGDGTALADLLLGPRAQGVL